MMSSQGLQSYTGTISTVRPISDAEVKAAKGVLKPMRANAIGIAVLSMVMAIMINFVTNPVAFLVPVFFSIMALGYAVQTRRTAGNLGKALASGTVTEVRAMPTVANPGRMWQFGGYFVPRSSELKRMVTEGVPSSFTVLPDARQLLAVNGMPLRKPVTIAVPPGVATPPVAAMTVPTPQMMPATANDDLPPPPEGWMAKACPKCGQSIEGEVMFCSKCGFRLKA